MKQVKIETNRGILVIELYDETQGTTNNFLNLVNRGFYNGLTFHRVIPNFVVQGGCPIGNGTGDSGTTIPCETMGDKQYHDVGVLSMAHSGQPNSGSSQFFICLSRKYTQHLDRKHTCFGKVIQGLEILPNITQGDVMINVEEIKEN